MREQKQNSDAGWVCRAGLLMGPVLFFLVLLLDLEPGNPMVTRMAAIATLMATWWITGAVPLAVTALIPMVLYPLFGISPSSSTASTYFNSVIFLFLGGFIIALTMERWNLHKRAALWMIRLVGGGTGRITLGFMGASAFLSMWISNTAAAILMIPMAMAIIRRMEKQFGKIESHRFAVGLILGIAYGCSIGGLATLVGTPTNLVFLRIFESTFPEAESITFGRWMVMGVPMAVGLLIISWVLLTKLFFKSDKSLVVGVQLVKQEYQRLGSMSFEEKTVCLIACLTGILWMFRSELKLGFFTLPGWSMLLPYPDLIDDGTVALFMALILFLIPVRSYRNGRSTLANLELIKRLPWSIVLLFGGGFALAKGFELTGLSSFAGHQLSGMKGIHPLLLIVLVCLMLTFLTELTSNMATTQIVLPILSAVGVSIGINPLLLMIPATLSASCAFMMPVATPPNTIVFGTGRIKVTEMARVGIILNLIGVLVITGYFYLVGIYVFGIDPNVLPEWAEMIP